MQQLGTDMGLEKGDLIAPRLFANDWKIPELFVRFTSP
jgi:hypothetical protein